MRMPRPTLVAAAVALLAILVTTGYWWTSRADSSRELMFTIPAGTGAKLAAGEKVDVLPQTIAIDLSEENTLVIHNADSEPVTIGPYKIEPGQRFSQRFYNPGTFDLLCSVHGGEPLRIVVQR